MEMLVFVLASAMVLAGAVGVIVYSNPVHAALSLVLTLFGIAVHFVALGAHFLAAVQVIVYAGAIVVLFLFVIMLLGVDKSDSLRDPVPFQRPTALALGAILLAEIIFLGGNTWATGVAPEGHVGVHGGTELGNNVERVARVLFTDYLWPFELVAALLVLAVVGSVVLARRSGERTVIIPEPALTDSHPAGDDA